MARHTARCWSSRFSFRRRHLHQFAEVAPQIVAQQPQQTGGQVADDDVMRGLGNRLMKCQIGIHLGIQIASGKSFLKLRQPQADALAVGRGGAARGTFRRAGLQHVAKLEQIVMDGRMVAENFLPRIGEARIEPVGDKGAAPLPAFQQTPRHQLLDGFPQRSPRDPQLRRQFTFGRQAIAGLESSFKHPPLNLARNHIGESRRYHFSVHFFNITLV